MNIKMKLNKQVFMRSLKQIALWRVAMEAGTVVVLIEVIGASLGWLLLPLFLTPVTTSQLSLIIPKEYYTTPTRKHAAVMCPENKWVFSCLHLGFLVSPQDCLVLGPQLLHASAI